MKNCVRSSTSGRLIMIRPKEQQPLVPFIKTYNQRSEGFKEKNLINIDIEAGALTKYVFLSSLQLKPLDTLSDKTCIAPTNINTKLDNDNLNNVERDEHFVDNNAKELNNPLDNNEKGCLMDLTRGPFENLTEQTKDLNLNESVDGKRISSCGTQTDDLIDISFLYENNDKNPQNNELAELLAIPRAYRRMLKRNFLRMCLSNPNRATNLENQTFKTETTPNLDSTENNNQWRTLKRTATPRIYPSRLSIKTEPFDLKDINIQIKSELSPPVNIKQETQDEEERYVYLANTSPQSPKDSTLVQRNLEPSNRNIVYDFIVEEVNNREEEEEEEVDDVEGGRDESRLSQLENEVMELITNPNLEINTQISLDSPKVKKKKKPQCKICSQTFSNYFQLNKHRSIHVGDKPYPCLKCGKGCSSLETLIGHIRNHQGKWPYVCKKCGKGFRTIKGLGKHHTIHILKKAPPPKKFFKCELCEKEFRKVCDLDRHMRVHTGEKPSVCKICNQRFQQQHNLNKHLLIHTQERPHKCDICSKSFGRNDVLNRHLLTHSVKKPFKCQQCTKTFIRASQLTAHVDRYHKTVL